MLFGRRPFNLSVLPVLSGRIAPDTKDGISTVAQSLMDSLALLELVLKSSPNLTTNESCRQGVS